MTLGFLFNNEYLRAVLILFLFIVFSKFFVYAVKKYIKHIASKTKTDLDDFMVESLKSPAYFLIILIGFYFSFRSLTFLDAYILWIKNIFFICMVIILTSVITKIIDFLVIKWLKVNKKFEKTPRLINRVINVVLYIIALLFILEHFNIKITPIVATLGVGALAIGLALQNTLTNLFAGLHIISDKPISVGDYIELQSENISGYVEDIGWRSTRIKTGSNNMVIIPNAKIADSIIVNYTLKNQEMTFGILCGVSYNEKLEEVEKITIEAAEKIQKNTEGCVKKFKPFVRYGSFGDSNINFSVIFKIEKYTDRLLVTHEFIKELKEAYDKNKIEMSYPARKVYMAK
ncbi:MAG: mechanosensitive ion channel family protein [Nanoarchaeota archaeon]